MSSVADLLETAMRLHQTGELAQAEQLYAQILQSEPRHADALYLLGTLAHQTRRHDLAMVFITQAITLDGTKPFYHNNLGEVHRTFGRLAEAQACYRQALALDPGFSAAHYNLGLVLGATQPAEAQHHYEQAIRLRPDFGAAHNNLGNLLRAQDKLNEAVEAYRSALRCHADNADAVGNLGTALLELERFSEAIDQFEQAVRLRPDSADAHFNLGNAHKAACNWPSAAECYARALRLRPNFAEAACNLGNALRIQGDAPGAKAAYLEVLRCKPEHVDALVGYGAVLQSEGKSDEAIEYYDRALRAKPDSALAHFYRGSVLMSRRLREDAVAAFTEALRLRPNYPEACANLAIVYNDAGQPDTALEYCRRGLDLGSNIGSLYGNMAIALHAQGRGREAIDCYRKSLALRPGNPAEHSNLLYALNLMPEYDPPALLAEHLEWARRHAEPLTAQAARHDNDRAPQRRLRVGYVSPHFHEHAVNYFVEPILTSHNHDEFEIFCYSSVMLPDAVTERLKAAADHWHDVKVKTDAQVAQMVRDDRIDILVDLSGHMGWTRLLVFARKPAPVQVTYIGYQNTTGMSAMDYRLTDDHADPPGVTDPFYTEQLVRLPRAFFCYKAGATPPTTPPPALENGYVTFGSFNNFAKVMPEVIETWLKILSRVPRSRLMVLAYRGGYLERHIHELAAQRGIDPDRIELFDKRWRQEYLQLVAQADIGLDPFPFNGHTTTCDSIWMGVPVVMLEGQTYASRFGGSVLANVGLAHLIARSVEDYIDLAVDLAGDIDRLSQLRGELRPRMAASPLADFAGFTRNLEQAYRRMWVDWCERADRLP